MLTVWIIRSVIASLLSLTALGKGLSVLAMFLRVSLLSLKNFSMLSLSFIIRSVMIYLFVALSAPFLFSVTAEEADLDSN